MPRSDADIPRPDGRRWMFVRARPTLARIPVPSLPLPIFIWPVYLRIVFKVVCDTFCSKAKSMSCRHRKSSSICRHVLDDIALMFSVAILNVWDIIGIVRGGTGTAKLIDSVRFFWRVLLRVLSLDKSVTCPSSVFCCTLGLIGGGPFVFPHHWWQHHFPPILWNLLLACLHAGVARYVW